jgi:hypothetical protein
MAWLQHANVTSARAGQGTPTSHTGMFIRIATLSYCHQIALATGPRSPTSDSSIPSAAPLPTQTVPSGSMMPFPMTRGRGIFSVCQAKFV